MENMPEFNEPDIDEELNQLLQQLPQATLRALCDSVQGVAMRQSTTAHDMIDHEPNGAMRGEISPQSGEVMSLVAVFHFRPRRERHSNMRHVATLTVDEFRDDGPATRRHHIWWGSNGDYYELRGDSCDEAAA